MKTEFSYEDFDVCLYTNDAMQVAEIANKKLLEIKKAWLEELVKDAPVVSRASDKPGKWFEDRPGMTYVESDFIASEIIKAHLVMVEETKK